MITDEEFKEHGFKADYTYSGGRTAIELDWFRPEQCWRSFRMHRVAGYLRAVADASRDYTLLQKIARIQDHKGLLFVYWHELPTDEEKVVLKNAWNSECEAGDLIEHELEETE